MGDVLHASGDWLLALEASLGEAVQFIVAERTDAALKALKALERGGGGRATFIALDRLSWARVAEIPEQVLSAPGVHGPLQSAAYRVVRPMLHRVGSAGP